METKEIEFAYTAEIAAIDSFAREVLPEMPERPRKTFEQFQKKDTLIVVLDVLYRLTKVELFIHAASKRAAELARTALDSVEYETLRIGCDTTVPLRVIAARNEIVVILASLSDTRGWIEIDEKGDIYCVPTKKIRVIPADYVAARIVEKARVDLSSALSLWQTTVRLLHTDRLTPRAIGAWRVEDGLCLGSVRLSMKQDL